MSAGRFSLDWPGGHGVRDLLRHAHDLASAAVKALDPTDVLELDRFGVSNDGRIAAAASLATRAAVAALVLGTLLASADDDERDALTERERDALRRLIDGRGAHPLEVAALARLLELVPDHSRVLADDVLNPGVDDVGLHGSSLAVGPVEGETSPVGGAAALGTPPAVVPTVGVPTDTSPDPSAGSVSVGERAGAAGSPLPPAAPVTTTDPLVDPVYRDRAGAIATAICMQQRALDRRLQAFEIVNLLTFEGYRL